MLVYHRTWIADNLPDTRNPYRLMTPNSHHVSHIQEAPQGLIRRKTYAVLWNHLQSICRPASVEAFQALLQGQTQDMSIALNNLKAHDTSKPFQCPQ